MSLYDESVVSGMGNKVRVYSPRALTGPIIAAVVGGLFIIVTGAIYALGIPTPVVCILAGVLPAIWGAGIIVDRVRNPNIHVDVYEKGMAYYNRKGVQSFRWDDVDLLWMQASSIPLIRGTSLNSLKVKIQLTNGDLIVIGNLIRDIEHLGTVIEEQVADHLLPAYKKTLASGKTIAFGALALSAKSLQYYKTSMFLEELGQIQFAESNLRIFKQGEKSVKWVIPLSEIPNLRALLILLRPEYGRKPDPTADLVY